jgi:hypothetical protein
VPCQQPPACGKQKQGKIQPSVASGLGLLFKEIVQIARAFVSQSQKGRTAYRHSDSFAACFTSGRRRRWSQRGPTHAAETVLGIILLAALNTSHCHGSRHHYTNSDAKSARPFGMPRSCQYDQCTHLALWRPHEPSSACYPRNGARRIAKGFRRGTYAFWTIAAWSPGSTTSGAHRRSVIGDSKQRACIGPSLRSG